MRRLSRNGLGREFPAYSSSHAGMGLVMEGMLAKGFTVAVAPGGVVWVAGNGREMKYVGGVAMPRAVAIAAVLAVQEGEPWTRYSSRWLRRRSDGKSHHHSANPSTDTQGSLGC